jgi:hypothetical protein
MGRLKNPKGLKFKNKTKVKNLIYKVSPKRLKLNKQIYMII